MVVTHYVVVFAKDYRLRECDDQPKVSFVYRQRPSCLNQKMSGNIDSRNASIDGFPEISMYVPLLKITVFSGS